ncbi:MAG: YgfZ/GcvT domain-containing protein [Luminiphilus sp.]
MSDAVIEFSGLDVRSVLQGQTTKNFEKLPLNRAIDGAFCDLKGRVIADFTAVMTSDDRALLRTDGDVAQALKTHLGKYLMFSKTTLTLLTWNCWGCSHSSPPMGSDDMIVVPRSALLYEVWCNNTCAPDHVITHDSWRYERFLRGEARICQDTMHQFLPQDLNYDLQGIIDFDKGCYTGQEIIARLHYRGSPKRRLSIVSVPGSIAPSVNDKVVDAGTSKTVGSIVEVAQTEAGWLCLSEVVVDAKDRTLQVRDVRVEIHALPS